jgi:hypothetical protein
MPTKKPRVKSDLAPLPSPLPTAAPVASEPALPQVLGLLHSGLVGELMAARQAVSALAAELAQREGELAALRAQLRRLHDDSLDRELDMTTLLRQEIAKRDKQYSKVLGSLSFRLGMSATAPMRWLFDKIAGSSKPAE